MTLEAMWDREPLSKLVTPSKERVEPSELPGDTPYLSLEHVEPRTGRILSVGRAADVRSSKTAFGAGDVLYGRLRPYLNKVCRPDFAGICSTEFLVFRPPAGVEGEYLRQVLSQRAVVQAASHAATGDLPRVSFKALGDIEVALPPKQIQARVAASAETTRVKSAHALQRIERTRALCRAAEREVLSRAFRGALTTEWRDQHPDEPSIEPTLDRIEAERVARASTKKQKEAARLRPLDGSALPQIPESWTWLALPDSGEMGRGRSRHRPRNDPALYGGSYPFIQTGDVTSSGGRITEFRQTYNEAGLEQSKLWPPGTVCITIAANIAATGVLQFDAAFPDSVVGVVTDDRLMLPEYLELFLRTARADLDRFAPATAQKNINLAILNDVAVPAPPLAEQHEIVDRVSRLHGTLTGVQRHAAAAAVRLDAVDGALFSAALQSEVSAA